MAETLFALLDDEGVVTNVIVADQEFIDTLQAQIDDENVDTGAIEFARAYDITSVVADDSTPSPGIGWRRARNGKWVAPTPPEPTQEELDARAAAQAEADRRAADDEFLAGLRTKMDAGETLTQDERDRLALIQLSRS